GRDLLVGGGVERHRERGRPLAHQVLAGVDGDDTGAGQGRRGVDGADAGPGDRAAHEGHPQGTGDVEVVDVFRFAGQDRGVLPAEETLTEHGGHALTPDPDPAAARTDLTM